MLGVPRGVDCGTRKSASDSDATATNLTVIRKPPIRARPANAGSTSRAGHRSYGGVAS